MGSQYSNPSWWTQSRPFLCSPSETISNPQGAVRVPSILSEEIGHVPADPGNAGCCTPVLTVSLRIFESQKGTLRANRRFNREASIHIYREAGATDERSCHA